MMTNATAIPYAIGIIIGVLTSLFLRTAGFDRDRAVYPTIVIVVALYYVLFAAVGGGAAMSGELAGLVIFTAGAVLGFRVNLWWAVAALAGHGVFDFFHSRLIANPGVPEWWPAFCLAADVGLAAFLAWLLLRGRLRARSGGPES